MKDGITTTTASTQPSMEGLRAHRRELVDTANRHGASNVRVFGSVARGEADEHSDVDLLLDLDDEVHGFAYFGMLEDLRRDFESVLHREVDVVDAAALDSMRDQVLSEAVPP